MFEIRVCVKDFYRHNRLINDAAIFETLRGNSMASMPFNITLYVFMGSGPENGGLNYKRLEFKIDRMRTHTFH